MAAGLGLACASRPGPVSDIHGSAPLDWGVRAGAIHARLAAFEAVYRGVWEPVSGGRRGVRLWVAAQGAQRLRLEVAGRAGGTLLTLVTDGRELMGASARAGEHVRGPARSGWIELLTGWPLEAEEAAGLLLADLPARLGLKLSPGGGISREAGRGLVFERDGGESEPTAVTIERDEAVLGRVAYLAWEERLGVHVPAGLKLTGPAGSLELRLEDLSTGVPRPGAFRLEPPAGSTRVPLPAEGERLDGWDLQGSAVESPRPEEDS